MRKYKQKNWRPRLYTLNGDKIDSSNVNGIVHTTRLGYDFCMSNCGKPIEPGQKYVQLLILGATPIHFDCYVSDSSSCILGVKIVKKPYRPTEVICQKFGKADSTEERKREA